MLLDLILWIPLTKKMSPLNIAFMPIFSFPFSQMYYQKTSILQLKNGQKYKNTHRLEGGAMKMVPEILRWCWKVKKMVLHHFKSGHGELWSIISLQSEHKQSC